MRVGEYNSMAWLFAADKWVLRWLMVGGPLSLLVDFVNGSVKRGTMPVLGLVNVHSA